MNQAPQMPRRASQLPSSPSHVIMLLIGQSQKRYAAIKEMLKNQVAGFADLQKESHQLALLYMQEDGGPDSQRIHRLALSLQAVFAAAEINGQDLQRHLQAELFLQGELNRFQMGKPPTHFQGPQSPQAQQPIVPGYQPPQQLTQGQDGAQQVQAPQQSYFRQGPNGLEPTAAFPVPQQQPPPQQPQMMPQPQMPFPMPGYAVPPGYAPQAPMQQPMPQMPAMPQMPQMPPQVLQGQPMYPPQYAQPQYPQPYPQAPYGYYAPPQAPPASMPVNHLPVMQQGQDPNAQPVLMPLMPQQQPMPQQQFATPEAARQAMMPDAPPPPAVPVGVVHFPTPNAPHDSQANGAAQPKQQ